MGKDVKELQAQLQLVKDNYETAMQFTDGSDSERRYRAKALEAFHACERIILNLQEEGK